MASIIQADTIVNAAGTGPVNFSKGYKASARVKDIANANYTILDSDGYDFITSATTLTAGRTITLPVPANNTGRVITFKKTDSGAFAFTIAVNGGLIDGASSNILTAQYAQITLLCDGTNWSVLNTSGDYLSLSVSSSFTPTTGSYVTSSALAIPPGIWDIAYNTLGTTGSSASTTATAIGISTDSVSTTFTDAGTLFNFAYFALNNTRGGSQLTVRRTLTSSTNYYAKAICYGANYSSDLNVALTARRIG